MRQRRPKNLHEKIENLSRYLIFNPRSFKGRWNSAFDRTEHTRPGNRIHVKSPELFLEIGTGKGRFINELARRNGGNFYIGIEGQDTVILRALEKISDNGLDNLKLCLCYVNDFAEFFDEDELDGIYLNFSDPWPKDRHEKRRLTSPLYLKGYALALKPGGFIKMKTDNRALFEYSLKQFENHPDFDILEVSEDLHDSTCGEENIMTEYEKRFSELAKKINYISVVRTG